MPIQAFPTDTQRNAHGDIENWLEPGCNLEDLFAKEAMGEFIRETLKTVSFSKITDVERQRIAKEAYDMADAMARERARRTG